MRIGERNLQALQSVTGRSLDDVQQFVRKFRAGVWVGPNVRDGSPALAAARLLVGLLARLYPGLSLKGPSTSVHKLQEEAMRINPDLEVADREVDIWLVIGPEDASARPGTLLHLGARGWHSLISSTPVQFDPECSVFAALVAACLAAWEAFRYGAGQAGFTEPWTQGAYGWNLLSYAFDPLERAQPATLKIAGSTCLPRTTLVGAGALAHGFTYALRELPDLQGMLTVVDNRPLKGDTLQRYACQYAGDQGPKVDLIHERLRGHSIEVIPVAKDILQHLTEDVPNCDLDVVVAAVDREDTRMRLQAALPRIIINGWTSQGKMGLSLHRFSDDAPCLACLYAPQELASVSEEARIQQALRGAIPVERIREMLLANRPLETDDVQALMRCGFPDEVVHSYLGKAIQSAYQGLICSGLTIAQPGQDPVDVPLAFMSALIGVLQALELVKLSVPELNVYSLSSRLQFDVLRRPNYVFAPRQKRPDCICTDPIYIQAYMNKWDAVSTRTVYR